MGTFQLIYDCDTDRYYLDDEALHCGDTLQVLIHNGLTGENEWIDTRIEKDAQGEWILYGLIGYRIEGLFARR